LILREEHYPWWTWPDQGCWSFSIRKVKNEITLMWRRFSIANFEDVSGPYVKECMWSLWIGGDKEMVTSNLLLQWIEFCFTCLSCRWEYNLKISWFQSCETLSIEPNYTMPRLLYYITVSCQACGNLLYSNRKLKSTKVFWNSAGIKVHSECCTPEAKVTHDLSNLCSSIYSGVLTVCQMLCQVGGYWRKWV
jgi:hypothetical protein